MNEADLDFVVPIPVGVKLFKILSAMRSARYRECLLGADEVGDCHAAVHAGYESLMASYGFDTNERLTERGDVPSACIYDSPLKAVKAIGQRIAPYALKRKVVTCGLVGAGSDINIPAPTQA
ncbi:MAG: hypothetical protein EXR86_15585 [Gammaproteobacteria bacterium]|nr:hypothetical protein [Gammaproteobacteria bacterium]